MNTVKKGGPCNDLDLRYMNGKSWHVKFDFCWLFRDGTKLCVKAGFVHDFNSVPWLFRRIMPRVEYGEGGTVHDWLYNHCGKVEIEVEGKTILVQWDREECDRRYLEILEDTGAPPFRRVAMHKGVRLGGWMAWNAHAKRIAKEHPSPQIPLSATEVDKDMVKTPVQRAPVSRK